ncbi:MAG: hypothetical protein ABH823_00805 [bacterium]
MIVGKIKPLVFILLLPLILTACNSKDKLESSLKEQETAEGVIVQPPTLEAEPREPVYVYGQQTKASPDELTLSINNEPLLVNSSYVRLVGVVSGGKPLALLEIAGRGLCLGVGKRVSDYQITEINVKGVKLERL